MTAIENPKDFINNIIDFLDILNQIGKANR
ncbi:hypothetical protein LCGC14_1046690 [marine sediment metagenome]|uniref:Uncharacterized protein n=1 Tax=marine sediment metagenome TaxID=412755 RepID=A0A0F9MQ63_9ZZZZ